MFRIFNKKKADKQQSSVADGATNIAADTSSDTSSNSSLDSSAKAAALKFIERGGITSPKGFRASGVYAGFRANPDKLDLALLVADEPCAAAGVFTKNVFCAPPVQVTKTHLAETGGIARAVIINSKIANAATGAEGLMRAKETAALTADMIGCAADEVLVASTGVIGVQLSMQQFIDGIPRAVEQLAAGEDASQNAAEAIMTTDTVPKSFAVQFDGASIDLPGCTFTIGGMAKGSGMIMPNMATMISVLTTDAPVASEDLSAALKQAVDVSFNKVTVDSDTSTNDTCLLLASGAVAPDVDPAQFAQGTPGYIAFVGALTALCTVLARAIAKDGEGATRLITVNVSGAQSPEDADAAARTVANSPLVKTAVFGSDANWGRIAAALGRSGAQFQAHDVAISMMGIPMCKDGLALDFDEDEALQRFANKEIIIDINLGAGSAQTTVWTCDFTHDYVTINGDYRT